MVFAACGWSVLTIGAVDDFCCEQSCGWFLTASLFKCTTAKNYAVRMPCAQE